MYISFRDDAIAHRPSMLDMVYEISIYVSENKKYIHYNLHNSVKIFITSRITKLSRQITKMPTPRLLSRERRRRRLISMPPL